MDPVEQIRHEVKTRVIRLGPEIISFAEEAKSIITSAGLSESDKTEMVDAARDLLRQRLDVVFGEGESSIGSQIQRVLEAAGAEAADKRDRAQIAARVWRQELPGLRRFLEYCSGMIEEHTGDASPEVRESQKCITEASVVLEKISERVNGELSRN